MKCLLTAKQSNSLKQVTIYIEQKSFPYKYSLKSSIIFSTSLKGYGMETTGQEMRNVEKKERGKKDIFPSTRTR